MWLPVRGTSDMTEATHFSQCVHDQQRRLEAEDCDSIRCAQLISGGRRRIRPPCTVSRSRSPTMRCIRLVISVTTPTDNTHYYYWASVSEPHTCDFNATFSLYICTYICYMLYATVTVLLTLRSIFRYFI